MKSSKKRFKTLSLVLACASLTVLSGLASAANNWNPQHILNTMKSPYQGNRASIAVIAHRGLVGNGCPENSTCSILNTYNNNIEAIELDVKQSSDGQLWLFHDQNAGRVIDHSPNFNIFQNGLNPSGWNPDIRTMTSHELVNSFLRDKNFAKTNYRPVPLGGALNTVVSHANHMVVVLDLKTLDAVSRAADLARSFRMENQVVLKFSASLLAGKPGDITRFTKGVAFAPTVYAGDMDRLADGGYTGLCGAITPNSPSCRVNAWIEQARGQNGFAWLEIGNKQPRRSDPTAELLAGQQAHHHALGAFSPVPEYRLSAHDGQHFVRSNGTCCAALSDYLTRTKYFGNEAADDRSDFGVQALAGFTSIITDDPLSITRSHIFRNTSRYE
ncbi:glycerophosphodiester phosphodiesterase family protein [Xanthomonas cerealis pv. cerealis]|uniref:glycerophosphodiester phosphodiesterase family protein n=1 Tax=Xanthomonas cerealis TaxID=3390025 RepID=UPI001F359618|nr:glycerophosphodiester phosphodiesterase family protein [Xanthomonas translucens]UKE68767.1 glycerophosphodiester phosphodiesterase family protein [Xanthomonas translucens pv. pistacia]